MRVLLPASRGCIVNLTAAAARAQAHGAPRQRWRQEPTCAVNTQQQRADLNFFDQRQQAGEMRLNTTEQWEQTGPAGAGDALEPPPTPSPRSQLPTRSGGALSQAALGGTEQEVPRTLRQVLTVFFSHPSSLLIVFAIAGLVIWRSHLPFQPVADLAVAACIAAAWTVQEWIIHNLLLHSKFDWVGRRIHVGHHQRPYFHVSIDDPPIVLAFMAGSLGLFWLGFGGSELAVTAAISYYGMGLCYEFTHYMSHTRYLPTSRLGKRIRMHHMLHHTKNEAYWLAFTVPDVDKLFGTDPDPASIRMSDMAKAALKRAHTASTS